MRYREVAAVAVIVRKTAVVHLLLPMPYLELLPVRDVTLTQLHNHLLIFVKDKSGGGIPPSIIRMKGMGRGNKLFFTTIKYCVKFSWNASKLYSIIRLICSILKPFISITGIYVTKLVLDIFVSQADITFKVRQVILWFIILSLLKFMDMAIVNLESYINVIHNEQIENIIMQDMFETALDTDLSMYDTPQYYDIFSSAKRDAMSWTNIVWNVILCFTAFLSFVTSFLALGRDNILFAVSISLTAVPSAFFGQKYNKILYQYDMEQITNQRQKNYIFELGTTRDFAQEVRCFNIGEMLKQKYKQLSLTIMLPKKVALKKRAILYGLSSLAAEALLAALMISIAIDIINNTKSIGDYSWYSGVLIQITGSISLVINYLVSINDNKLRIQNMDRFNSLSIHKIKSGNTKIRNIETIEFCQVSFKYPSSDTEILKNINLKINQGEHVALIGINGAGKSTIIKLLLRLYDVTDGMIFINGKGIYEYNICDLRSCFGIYFQNGSNFQFSLKENIILNNGITEENELEDFLNQCGMEDIVKLCGNNLNTYIGRCFSNDVIEFSVGQRQKIALARAMFPNKPAYILDEPSSSLDLEAERKIFNYIFSKYVNKIVLFTAHRFSVLDKVDKVILLENGFITEQGTVEELLKQRKQFARLYNYQAEKFRRQEEL